MNEQREQFDEQGYTGPIRVLSTKKCRQFKTRADHAVKRKAPPEWGKGLAVSSRDFYRISKHPEILNVVGSLLGENVMLWGADLLVRATHVTHPWHSDMESASTLEKTVSVWIGIENTCRDSSLQIISFSHRLGVTIQEQRHRHGKGRKDTTTADILSWAHQHDKRCRLVSLDASDGEAVFFHGHLWHSSFNASDRPRTALLLQYAVPEAKIRIPDLNCLDWPLAQFELPKPSCIMVRGHDTGGR